jgi:hypothetical protein
VSISVVLDVAIGLALVFLVFSVAVSKLNEMVTTFLNTRGKQLEGAIIGLLGNDATAQTLSNTLMNGPWKNLRVAKAAGTTVDAVVTDTGKALKSRARKLSLPAYISGDAFAKGVLRLSGIPVDEALHDIDVTSLPMPAQAAYTVLATARTKANADALLALVPAADLQRGKVQMLVDATSADPLAEASTLISNLPADNPLGIKLRALTARYGTDRTQIIDGLTSWYDETMDRLSGAYKRRVQVFVLAYATALTLLFNVNAIALTNALWQSGTTRDVVVAAAQAQLKAGPSTDTGETVQKAADDAGSAIRGAESLSLPLGWTAKDTITNDPRRWDISATQWLLRLLGWLITVFALSFGAPFWFDALGKLVNMRGSGPSATPKTT